MSAPLLGAFVGVGASYAVVHHLLGCAPDPPQADQIGVRLPFVGHGGGSGRSGEERMVVGKSEIRRGGSDGSVQAGVLFKDAQKFKGPRQALQVQRSHGACPVAL